MYQLMTITLAVILMGAAENRPPLVDAAKAGDKEAMVRLLSQKGVNVNVTEGDGTTALHWASYHDDLDSANQLLRAGANVNAANDLGATPLWAASQNGSVAMVKRLLDAGANPNLALLAGETPTMVASRAGAANVVELLIAKGANVNAHGSRGQTALMWAVAEKHPEVVKVLIAHGANLQAKSDVWSQVMAVEPHGYLPYNKEIPAGGETALMFAARVGDLASAKLLVAAGADVNDTDAWGVSATTLAAHSDFRDVAEFLLEKGADPNASAAGFNALHNAIMQRDEKLVASLLAHGADPNAILRTWTPNRRSATDLSFGPQLVGATPFWLAARATEPGIMKLLLQYKADPLVVHKNEHIVQDRAKGYVPQIEETTALMAAVGLGGTDEATINGAWIAIPANEREARTLATVKITVELGVDVNAKNVDGSTALDGAKKLRMDSVTKYLTDNGAKAGSGGGRGRGANP
jgi:uncharacterized protein